MINVAHLLHKISKKAFLESSVLPWPPIIEELHVRVDKSLPDDIDRLHTIVLSGEHEVGCEKTHRLVPSLGQDICRPVTNGEWKLPKHIHLCATVRHLYRSKQLSTILQKSGHCDAYDFWLEVESAVAKDIDDASKFLK